MLARRTQAHPQSLAVFEARKRNREHKRETAANLDPSLAPSLRRCCSGSKLMRAVTGSRVRIFRRQEADLSTCISRAQGSSPFAKRLDRDKFHPSILNLM